MIRKGRVKQGIKCHAHRHYVVPPNTEPHKTACSITNVKFAFDNVGLTTCKSAVSLKVYDRS